MGLGTALSLMGDATLYVVLPTHTAEAGIPLASVGILLGVNRAVRLLTNGPVGLAYDRWPRRRLFVPSLFVGALSTALYATTRGFWPLMAGRLLWGLAWSGIWVGGTTVLLDVTTGQDRGRFTGLYQIWFFLGAGFGALAGGILTDRVGYTAAMWIAAGLTALGGLAAWIWLPETAGMRQNAALRSRWVGPKLGANRRLWLAVSLQAANRFIIAGVLMATMGLLVQDQFGSAGALLGVATLTGLLTAGRTSLSMLAAPVAGAASDRLGSRWRVCAWALAVGAAGMALAAQSAPAAIVAGIALAAAASGGIQTLTTALTGDLVSQEQRGRAIGLLHTAGDLGSAIGPPVAYALLPWLTLTGIYGLCAALFAAQWVVMLWFQSRQTQPMSYGL